ncbi:hypothetical protein G6M17_03705 [Agrobacterium tumefaciens]|uniref:hypothetical protein n=1 Tax=Rhizobium/Agrobacterium group TaxID=227290 RepID=UPI0013C311F3|nr:MULTISPECIES: hypothetical protein [Rhizobium/Agrobacterium group]MCZ7445536.1 hypothetical protein [Rhizobium rhizogenes]NSZ78252.1 hypothetical protein [Agrobacterium tumefaciens]
MYSPLVSENPGAGANKCLQIPALQSVPDLGCGGATFGAFVAITACPNERGPSLRQAPGLNVAALFQGTRDTRRLRIANPDPQPKKLPVTAIGPEFQGHRDDQLIAIKKEARCFYKQRASVGPLGGATTCKFAFCA